MKTYNVCIVSKEFRYFDVECQSETEAENWAKYQIWNGDFKNTEPSYYDKGIYIEDNDAC